jgi:hypothetical protein
VLIDWRENGNRRRRCMAHILPVVLRFMAHILPVFLKCMTQVLAVVLRFMAYVLIEVLLDSGGGVAEWLTSLPLNHEV